MTIFLRKKWQTLVLFMLMTALLAFLFSVVQPQKYRSEQRFLVVTKFAEDVDPYAATRSTEYLTNLLSEVMYSQDFLNRAVNAGYAVDESLFPQDAKKRKKVWQKTVATRVLGDTGILDVTVYHTNRYTTEQIALAVGEVLRTSHGHYHSRGNAVTIQTIDAPVTSARPVQPNILLNTAAGLVLGLVSGLAFIYLFPKREWRFVAEKHRLVQPQEPDWTRPLATPVPVPAYAAVSDEVYPVSELKYPLTGKRDAKQKAEPPSNLPIA